MAGHTTGIRRPGRRTGDSGTKEAILAAALESFADRGYDATSVRAVAKQAEVDPGLIRHYFGSKKQLFTAAVVDRSELGDRILDALDGPTDSVGERIVRAYLDLWESPGTGPVLQTLFRSAVASEDLAPLFVDSMVASLQGRSGRALTSEFIGRFPTFAPQILGVAVCRYVLHIPLIAEEPLDEVVARLAPDVQQKLTG